MAEKAIISKYEAAGYVVRKCKSGNINDFVAYKGKKTHFVRVKRGEEDVNCTGIPLNDFIRNAITNDAIPVIADKAKKSGTITTYDANSTKSISLRPLQQTDKK